MASDINEVITGGIVDIGEDVSEAVNLDEAFDVVMETKDEVVEKFEEAFEDAIEVLGMTAEDVVDTVGQHVDDLVDKVQDFDLVDKVQDFGEVLWNADMNSTTASAIILYNDLREELEILLKEDIPDAAKMLAQTAIDGLRDATEALKTAKDTAVEAVKTEIEGHVTTAAAALTAMRETVTERLRELIDDAQEVADKVQDVIMFTSLNDTLTAIVPIMKSRLAVLKNRSEKLAAAIAAAKEISIGEILTVRDNLEAVSQETSETLKEVTTAMETGVINLLRNASETLEKTRENVMHTTLAQLIEIIQGPNSVELAR